MDTSTPAIAHVIGDTVDGQPLCSRCGALIFGDLRVEGVTYVIGRNMVVLPMDWREGMPWPDERQCRPPVHFRAHDPHPHDPHPYP